MDDQFQATAERLFPQKVAASLCTIEHLIRLHEYRIGRPVTEFDGYLAATRRTALRNDPEARTWFEMWRRVRGEMGDGD